MAVQTGAERILEARDNFNGWGPHMEGFPGTVNENGNFIEGYTRQVPDHFVGDAAEEDRYIVDKFTQSMITKYAIEGVEKDKDGKEDPKRTHQFYLTKASARDAATEVLGTHFGMKGQEAADFLSKNYDAAWDYFDVNGAGRIDAIGSSTFFRYLTRSLGAVDLQ